MPKISKKWFGINAELRELVQEADTFSLYEAIGEGKKEIYVTISQKETVGHEIQVENEIQNKNCELLRKEIQCDTFEYTYIFFKKEEYRKENSIRIEPLDIEEKKPSSFSMVNCGTNNRLDLSYPKHEIHWLQIKRAEQILYLPIRVKGQRAWISILYIMFSSKDLESIVTYIFKRFNEVLQVSFVATEKDPQIAWKNLWIRHSSAWILPLKKSFEETFDKSKRKTRWDIRRRKRNLESVIGLVRCEEYNKNIPLFDVLVSRYLEMKKRKYNVPDNEGTIENILDNPKLDVTNAYVLKAENEKILSVLFTSEHISNAKVVNMSYDIDYEKFSPGLCLYIEVVRLLTEKGYKSIYLGSGTECYKKLFGAVESEYWVGDAFR